MVRGPPSFSWRVDCAYNQRIAMLKPNRREALVTIAAGAAAQACAGPEKPSGPLSAAEIDRLGALVDTILPSTDTPGARQAGVPALIAEDCAADAEKLAAVRGLLGVFEEAGFFEADEDGRAVAMTAMMDSEGAKREAFEALKSLTVDYYYATEIGLVDELGYQGATYLADFPGCTHDHLSEEA